MTIANCQLPIANYRRDDDSAPIGNWQLAIGNRPAPLRRFVASSLRRSLTPAFSLVEMMIAIVILGLGLVMVATMFPVAWDRARTLSEHTIEQSAAQAAQASIEAIVRASGATLIDDDNDSATPTVAVLNSGSFAGDMFYDPELTRRMLLAGGIDDAYRGVVLYSDTRVHVLHMENVLAKDGSVVREHPWKLERIHNIVDDGHPQPGFDPYFSKEFASGPPDDTRQSGLSFYFPQVRVGQRIFGALDSRPEAGGVAQDRWNDRLANRRFCWAVLHRLRGTVDATGQLVPPIGPPCETQQNSPQCFFPYLQPPYPQPLCPSTTPPTPRAGKLSPSESLCITSLAQQGAGATRNFDMYYVTLRRPQPTHRYARQDPTPAKVPDPYVADASIPPVAPAPLGADQDVLLPAAWRVQVEFFPSLNYRGVPGGANPLPPSGVPTEIRVPPTGLTGQAARMVVSMFPQGTQFIDEMTGLVFRVAKRRVADDGESAVLTLDREILQEEIDIRAEDRRVVCGGICTDSDPNAAAPDPDELRRTVWVFPPPVDRSAGDTNVMFDGPSPVVGIEIRALSAVPAL